MSKNSVESRDKKKTEINRITARPMGGPYKYARRDNADKAFYMQFWGAMLEKSSQLLSVIQYNRLYRQCLEGTPKKTLFVLDAAELVENAFRVSVLCTEYPVDGHTERFYIFINRNCSTVTLRTERKKLFYFESCRRICRHLGQLFRR